MCCHYVSKILTLKLGKNFFYKFKGSLKEYDKLLIAALARMNTNKYNNGQFKCIFSYVLQTTISYYL